MIFTTEGFSKVAIESWSGWDLNPKPTIRVNDSNRLTYQTLSLTCNRINFLQLLQFRFLLNVQIILVIALVSCHVCFNLIF